MDGSLLHWSISTISHTHLFVFVYKLNSSSRLVSEKTVEENILKKANQKRMLGDVAIEGGNFTTAYFKSVSTYYIFCQYHSKTHSFFVCFYYKKMHWPAVVATASTIEKMVSQLLVNVGFPQFPLTLWNHKPTHHFNGSSDEIL